MSPDTACYKLLKCIADEGKRASTSGEQKIDDDSNQTGRTLAKLPAV